MSNNTEDELYSLQQNPNNIEYWKLRGWSYRPDDWYERTYNNEDEDYDDNEEEEDEGEEEGDEEEDYEEEEDFEEEELNEEEDFEEEEDYLDEEECEEEEFCEEEEDSENSDAEFNEESDDDDDYENHRYRSIRYNPNNPEFWRVKGWSDRPEDWWDRMYGDRN